MCKKRGIGSLSDQGLSHLPRKVCRETHKLLKWELVKEIDLYIFIYLAYIYLHICLISYFLLSCEIFPFVGPKLLYKLSLNYFKWSSQLLLIR